MELNGSTFVLEIINFLVLVWILKRFLYRPVLEVIERRRATIGKKLADAEALHNEAVALQEKYEGRLADWEQERNAARSALARELDAERARRLAGLRTALDQEREQAQAVEARRRAAARRTMEETALARGAGFAARLLERAAGPETERRLAELALDALSGLPEEQRAALLRDSTGEDSEAIEVASAWPLPDPLRRRLAEVLAAIAGPDIPLHFHEDRDLVAGIRITIGARELAFNIRDELQDFRELSGSE